jgi:hypothetical protein
MKDMFAGSAWLEIASVLLIVEIVHVLYR